MRLEEKRLRELDPHFEELFSDDAVISKTLRFELKEVTIELTLTDEDGPESIDSSVDFYIIGYGTDIEDSKQAISNVIEVILLSDEDETPIHEIGEWVESRGKTSYKTLLSI